ncbi:YpmA family protein [Tumebacillus sp. DT12]|uniref:YpmA family protein n=1 Tax=Tumebacillus lacus TaxID=2995335 RepID=A0ABT3WVJ7_9BACL|nr:YpmA family protein [Tumebacillus lacus]MCX7568713.1 YpmA family protein [Tumebacillus lacus]
MDSTKLVTLGTQTVADPSEWYEVVDFLNRTCKERGLVFGLTKGQEEGTFNITVYEERDC